MFYDFQIQYSDSRNIHKLILRRILEYNLKKQESLYLSERFQFYLKHKIFLVLLNNKLNQIIKRQFKYFQ